MTTEIVLGPARPPVPPKSLPARIERAGGAGNRPAADAAPGAGAEPNVDL